jgi:hypothetical protein
MMVALRSIAQMVELGQGGGFQTPRTHCPTSTHSLSIHASYAARRASSSERISSTQSIAQGTHSVERRIHLKAFGA